MGSADEGYVLGHTGRELRRLDRQAALVDPITLRFLRDGGISEGMRVLDVGSGGGHVAFLAAALVGPSGEVVGVDRSAAAVETAGAGAHARSLGNVSFVVGDPVEMVFGRPFDAVVGRYVLQFQSDPVRALRTVVSHARAGGLVVLHELDWSGVWSLPASPTYDRCCAWAMETLRRSGAETQMGLKLRSIFVAAGLAEPSMRMEAVIAGGSNSSPVVEQVADLVETLSPAIQRLGVATAGELDRETLRARMLDETTAGGGVVIGRLQVGCWSHV